MGPGRPGGGADIKLRALISPPAAAPCPTLLYGPRARILTEMGLPRPRGLLSWVEGPALARPRPKESQLVLPGQLRSDFTGHGTRPRRGIPDRFERPRMASAMRNVGCGTHTVGLAMDVGAEAISPGHAARLRRHGTRSVSRESRVSRRAAHRKRSLLASSNPKSKAMPPVGVRNPKLNDEGVHGAHQLRPLQEPPDCRSR